MTDAVSKPEQYSLEVYSDRESRYLNRHFNRSGDGTYVFRGSRKECETLQKKSARRGYDTRLYRSVFGRSDNYRRIFFDLRGPQVVFRCAYCGKTIRKAFVTVDHVIPVHDTKRYFPARLALKLMGCDGANDPKNLVPSCFKCNERKGTSWNPIYLIRSKFGENEGYWKAVKIARWCLAIALLAVIVIWKGGRLK